MVRVIISDEFGQHGLDIKTAIATAYGGGGLNPIEDQIEIIGGWTDAYNRAVSDSNIIALIRSTGGVASYVSQAQAVYPRVQTFFPLGSNSFEQLTNLTSIPVIVTCGAGDTNFEVRNNTGYGLGLEFWDNDLLQSADGDASSFANGFILGKLLKIKDTLSCSWWEARFRARMTATRLEPNRETFPWDLRNGYGIIDVDAAIAYTGMIAADPYLVNDPPAEPPVLYQNTEINYTLPVPDGYAGDPVEVNIPAGTVYSTQSLAVANEIALSHAKILAESASSFTKLPPKYLLAADITKYGQAECNVLELFTLKDGIVTVEIEQFMNANEFNNNRRAMGAKVLKLGTSACTQIFDAIYQAVREHHFNHGIIHY